MEESWYTFPPNGLRHRCDPSPPDKQWSLLAVPGLTCSSCFPPPAPAATTTEAAGTSTHGVLPFLPPTLRPHDRFSFSRRSVPAPLLKAAASGRPAIHRHHSGRSGSQFPRLWSRERAEKANSEEKCACKHTQAHRKFFNRCPPPHSQPKQRDFHQMEGYIQVLLPSEQIVKALVAFTDFLFKFFLSDHCYVCTTLFYVHSPVVSFAIWLLPQLHPLTLTCVCVHRLHTSTSHLTNMHHFTTQHLVE